MEYVAIVTLIALLEYLVFSFMTGAARGRFDVPAPAISGHPEFERYFRVQQNTLEQLVIFVPSLWLFGYYLSGPLAALLGCLFLIGRVLYCVGYVRAPNKRGLGFLVGEIGTAVLLVGALYGVARALI